MPATAHSLSRSHLLENYRRAPVTFVRGEGCELIDDTGRRYLDFVGGIAVCVLGHAHPRITAAVAEQAATLVHCSNLYGHEPAGRLAGELARRSGFGRVFFCNSGTEANEAAIKLARKAAFRRGDARRTILSCTGSFHGRTLGALAATANAQYHEGFDPLPGGFATVEFNDIGALEARFDATIAAFIVEPVQGESGIFPASRAYLEAARALCDRDGALLIFDEIQCGMGRLGPLFAFEYYGVRPDLVTLAKALANGLPIGAVLIDEKLGDVLRPGDHGTTFGGSPIPCAAALAHLTLRDELALEAHVTRVGRFMFSKLANLVKAFPTVFGAPRGFGLLLGLPVLEPFDAKALALAALDDALLVNAAGDNTLRFAPPLIIDETLVETGVTRLATTMRRVTGVESR